MPDSCSGGPAPPPPYRRSAGGGIDRLGFQAREERGGRAERGVLRGLAAPPERFEDRGATVAVIRVSVCVPELLERAWRDRWQIWRRRQRHEPRRLDEITKDA